jgi:hypothetical protein
LLIFFFLHLSTNIFYSLVAISNHLNVSVFIHAFFYNEVNIGSKPQD